MKNNLCNQCGKCCETIWLDFTKKEIKEALKRNPENYDAKFILNNWSRISRKYVKNKNPYILSQFPKSGYFYKCKRFNKINKNCDVYKNRPRICSEFPLYKHDKYQKIINGITKLFPTYSLYSKTCGFQKIKATNKEWYDKDINKKIINTL